MNSDYVLQRRATLQSNSSNEIAKREPTFMEPQTIVTIIVGPDGASKSFIAYKDFICSNSPFFEAAFCTANFIEGKSQSMRLEDVDTTTFGLLLEFVHMGCIQNGHTNTILQMAKLWILAERFLMTTLQNHTMDIIVDMMNSTPLVTVLGFMEYVYKTSQVKEMPLKLLAMDLLVNRGLGVGKVELDVWVEKGPSEMAWDVAKALQIRCEELQRFVFPNQLVRASNYYVGRIAYWEESEYNEPDLADDAINWRTVKIVGTVGDLEEAKKLLIQNHYDVSM